MVARIAMLAGDGIGPEVAQAAREVLEALARVGDKQFTFESCLIGGAAIDATGVPMPDETLARCRDSDAVLLGAVGGPKWSGPSVTVRPEQGLLQLRQALDLYANLRPVKPHPELLDASPLKPERLDGVDLVVVRELTGGIYFGEKTRSETSASDLCTYHVHEIERIVRRACRLAMSRSGRVTSVDKSNVLETSRLWRETVNRIVPDEFPQVTVDHLLVDAAAMFLMSRPADFDVIVTENMFGDILTDEASMLAGSMGLLPSASLSDDGPGLYEPIHGSAPDIAGRGVANPCAAVLSAAMMLRFSLGWDAEADQVERAVSRAVSDNIRTPDIAAPGVDPVSTEKMTAGIIERLSQ